jgi:hypothetical protein
MGRWEGLLGRLVTQFERLLGLLRDNMLTVAVVAGLIAIATTPIAFAVLARLDWFRARRGRVMQKPEFWSVVCAMLLVMGLPAIFCALAIKSQYFDKDRYAFDPNRVPSVLDQGRQYEGRELLKSVQEADRAVKEEMDRLRDERKALQVAVNRLDQQILLLGQQAIRWSATAEVMPGVVDAMGVVRKAAEVDAKPAWQELVAILNDPKRRMDAQSGGGPAAAIATVAAAPGAASSAALPTSAGPAWLAAELAGVPDEQKAVAALVPFDALPAGWEAGQAGESRLQTFRGERMYELIDGRAESFLQYNCSGMAYAFFKPKGDDSGEVQLYIYEFPSSLKAFGKYGSEKTPESLAVDVGSEGFTAAGSVSFYKGRYFGQLVSTSEAPKFADFSMTVAQAVADRIDRPPGSATGPTAAAAPAPGTKPAETSTSDATDPAALFKLLPDSPNPGQPQYVAQDAFGYSFLSDVFLADYSQEGASWQGFLRPYSSADEARAVFARYLESARSDGAKIEELSFDGADRAAVINAIGLFDIIFLRGNVLGGANGSTVREPAETFARSFLKRLPAEIPWNPASAGPTGSNVEGGER